MVDRPQTFLETNFLLSPNRGTILLEKGAKNAFKTNIGKAKDAVAMLVYKRAIAATIRRGNRKKWYSGQDNLTIILILCKCSELSSTIMLLELSKLQRLLNSGP